MSTSHAGRRLAERARARVESNLARWPDDFWVRLHAGDALAVLGDIEAATAHFEVALDMADNREESLRRLRRMGRVTPRSTAGGRPGQKRRPAKGRGRSRRKRKR